MLKPTHSARSEADDSTNECGVAVRSFKNFNLSFSVFALRGEDCDDSIEFRTDLEENSAFGRYRSRLYCAELTLPFRLCSSDFASHFAHPRPRLRDLQRCSW